MKRDDLYYLGKILRTHGNKGQLLVRLEVDSPGKYQNLESVYLDLHGERIPFFIREIEIRLNGKAILRFEDTDTAEEAEIFTGLEMYLPLDQLPRLKGKHFYYHEIIGFRVIDQARGETGIISGILDMPQQTLLQVRHNEKEILIPAVDEIIIKIDRKKKILRIAAPEGLIDLYL